MIRLSNSNFLTRLSILMVMLIYLLVGYTFERHQTEVWLCYWVVLSLSYAWWMWKLEELSLKEFIGASILFRLAFTFSIPGLSDDFYRFLWDGSLWNMGINPFSMTPREVLEQTNDPRLQNLFIGVYGKDYATVYPPLAQLGFWLAAKFSEHLLVSIIVLRMIVFLFEAGTFLLLIRLLETLKLDSRRLLMYSLNPLIILEFSGNLHHEAYVLFFLALVFWWMIRQHYFFAALSFSGAVLSKLVPLLFLPSLIRWLSNKNSFRFVSVVLILTVFGILLMTDRLFLDGLVSGLSLYYQKFEFNPSLWYIVRAVGFAVTGYNIIGVAAPALLVIGGLVILMLSLRQPKSELPTLNIPDLANQWIILLSVYLLCSTIVHPWYIAPLVFLSVLGTIKYPLLWSCLILLTYSGYTADGYMEYPIVLVLEYLPVLIFIIWEWKSASTLKI